MCRPRFARRLTALLLMTGLLAPRGSAQDFDPPLGHAAEMIDGGTVARVEIPTQAAELQTYPMPTEYPRQLLQEVPGRPFRPVDPPPQAFAWWKVPFYVALGLPRDLVDGFVGGLAKVPIISPVFVFPAYELVPTQIVFRDPRDWHRWPAGPNRHDHGYYKGNSWGWFPSAHMWKFHYTSERKLERNRAYNERLQAELRDRNREIETHNQLIENRKREARREALRAIEAGDGREAALRMIPYYQAYPLDEGAFALFATALAIYAPEGPEWVKPLLWYELNAAQPLPLTQAETQLALAREQHPERASLAEALIYVRLLLGEPRDALVVAAEHLTREPDDARRRRLVLETALSADDLATARQVYQALDSSTLETTDAALIRARMDLLAGDYRGAQQLLRIMHQEHPEDAYVSYYLGIAELQLALYEPAYPEGFEQAFDLLEQAVLRAPNAALRVRAGQTLAYARGLGSEIEEEPELFQLPGMVPGA
ncbi:MAG: hypothetical protein BWZ08_02236 [candidate division BRC1 bacterium ADurb.BinA292]|nr:MAG: hypothetical protein BWZ08_02236 [candidate division BRC1 bacterium ADurb.BinA292]